MQHLIEIAMKLVSIHFNTTIFVIPLLFFSSIPLLSSLSSILVIFTLLCPVSLMRSLWYVLPSFSSKSRIIFCSSASSFVISTFLYSSFLFSCSGVNIMSTPMASAMDTRKNAPRMYHDVLLSCAGHSSIVCTGFSSTSLQRYDSCLSTFTFVKVSMRSMMIDIPVSAYPTYFWFICGVLRVLRSVHSSMCVLFLLFFS